MEAPDLAARLSAALPRLAELLVDDWLATPLADLAPHARAFLAGAADALARDDAAERALAARAGAALAALPAGPLAAALPAALIEGAREIARLRWRVPRALTRRLLGREPVRQLLRAQVARTLVEFARKAAAPFTENPFARGLSKLAFGDRTSPTALGALRTAVSGEAEKRAADFADTAVDQVIEGIAAELADPARAGEQADLRAAVLDGLLALSGAELRALAAPHVGPALAAARRALGRWRPTLVDDVSLALERALAGDARRPLGDVLADLGLRDAVREHAVRLAAARLGALVDRGAFAGWLAEALSKR